MMTLRAAAVASAFALSATAIPVETPVPTEATVQSLMALCDSQRMDVVVGVRGNAPAGGVPR